MSDDVDAIASLGAKVSAIETDLAHERKLSQMLLGIVINLYGAALEGSSAIEKIDGKLDRLIESIAELRATKADAVDLAAVRGRVEALPTTWQLITLVLGIFVGAFAILNYGLPHTP